MRSVPDDDVSEGEKRLAWRRAVTETRAVLTLASSTWAPWSCPGTAECCQLKTTGRPPWLWPSEWLLLLEGLKRQGRPLPPPRADGGCAFLDASGQRCTVYADRPFGCRTFFCHRIQGPRQVPATGTNALLERLAALNLAVDDQATVESLPALHEQAWRAGSAGDPPES